MFEYMTVQKVYYSIPITTTSILLSCFFFSFLSLSSVSIILIILISPPTPPTTAPSSYLSLASLLSFFIIIIIIIITNNNIFFLLLSSFFLLYLTFPFLLPQGSPREDKRRKIYINEQDTDASHIRNNSITESGVMKSQENLHLTQKGLTAKSRRELRAKRKQAAAEAEQRELDLAVANLFRVADSVTDHRAISRDGWGVDHGYTGISFSSPSKKADLSITQDKGSFKSSFIKKSRKKNF